MPDKIKYKKIDILTMDMGEVETFEEETGKSWAQLANNESGAAGLMGLVCLQERRAGRQVRDGQDNGGHAIYRDITMDDLRAMNITQFSFADDDPPTEEPGPDKTAPADKKPSASASKKAGTAKTSDPSVSSTDSDPTPSGE